MAANNREPSSSSDSDSRYRYDIFLSFRGEDTRDTFTDHLYTALVQSGLQTFRDEEEIRTGENIKSELVSAIQHSRGSIIVFSKTYAFSRWCLDELVMIMALNKNPGSSSSKFVVLPVFYDVDPTNIRRQSGIVGEAFAKYEERIKAEKDEGKVKELTEKVSRWKEALTDAADLSGMVLQEQSNRKESKFIQKVVAVIRDNIRRPVFYVGPRLVGIQERAKHISKWLDDESAHVNVIGISGMGGIGKTTIAKFVFNQYSGRFEGSSFLANVREISKQPNGLASLQLQLLSDVTKGRKEKISDVDEGMVKIKYAISRKRILLVLDDVDHLDQLNAILGMRDWFFPGSKIIITSRYKGLLKLPMVDRVYKVEKFTDDEAIELMTFHAFGLEPPNDDFMNLTVKAVNLCGGLPLALRVIGSSLAGQKADVWASALKKLEDIPNYDILKKLKISYDSLQDDHDKNLFLHIACFFMGEDKDRVIIILDECEFYTTVGIKNLIDRCLITIDSTGTLMMHQLLQDMGREIVRQESSDPGKRSRLWNHKESFDVLKNKIGENTIQGLILNMQIFKRDKRVETKPRTSHRKRRYFEEFPSLQENPRKRSRLNLFSSWFGIRGMTLDNSNNLELDIGAFLRMKKLRLLQLNYAEVDGSYGEFPQELRWLCWHGFPLKTIPVNLHLNNVVSLDMQHSNLKHAWPGIKLLGSLKILNLSYSKGLVQTPNFSEAPKLERLLLKGCTSLSEVCESIGVLEGLVVLDLGDCEDLTKLPRSICKLTGLQTLNLSGCPNAMGSLGMLLADGIPISSLGTTVTEIVSWTAFPWSWMSKRRNYADTCTISLPACLRELHLSGCNLRDGSFPREIGNLSLLNTLNLSDNPLQSLPDCITNLGLTELWIESCEQLQSLRGLPETLGSLNIGFNPSLEIVESSGGGLARVQLVFPECPNLAKVDDCFLLEHIAEVDREIIYNLGFEDIELLGNIGLYLHNGRSVSNRKRPIQVMQEFGILSTFVPGVAVPSWFTEKKLMGQSLAFKVPADVRIRCLNLCCLFQRGEHREEDLWDPNPAFVEIHNKTKHLTWSYRPLVSGYVSDDKDKVAWLSQWKLGDDELGGSDRVTVTFPMSNGFQVSECGYKFLFHENGENEEWKVAANYRKGNDEERGVIGGDWSDYKSSKGAYRLSHPWVSFCTDVARTR